MITTLMMTIVAITTATTTNNHLKGDSTMRSRLKQRTLMLVFDIFGAIIPVGIAQAQTPSPAQGGEGRPPINAICPVLTDEPIDPRFTFEYEGVTIGLCCRKCLTQFTADPSAYIANIPELLPASMADQVGSEAEHAHSDEHTHEDTLEMDMAMSEPAEHDHDHDHDLDHERARSKLAVWIGKFHPPATHLPIGLLFGAAIAEALLIVTRKDRVRHAVSFCVVFASLGAVAAATLGWFNGGVAFIDDDWVKTTHRWIGTGTAILSLLTLLVFARVSRANSECRLRGAFRVLLFSSTLLVGAAGFFGGSLVYGINHYAW